MLGGRLTRFFFLLRVDGGLLSFLLWRWVRKETVEEKQHCAPLHLFVVLSRMAFVDTILPYLEEGGGSERWASVNWIMQQTEPVIKHTHTHSHTDAQRSRVEQQAMTSLLKYEKQEVVSMACWKSPPSERESFNSPLSLQPLKLSSIVAAQVVLDHFRQVGRWGSIV